MRSELYAKNLDAPGPIRASLDVVSDRGTVEGWAIYSESPAVCHVQVRLGGVALGEDMADKFRPDLLSAGLRHGHCAFYIMIPIFRQGHYPLELTDGRTGQAIVSPGSEGVLVPQRVALPEDAPSERPGWTDEQVLANLTCLQLDTNYEQMGADRFVDAVFRFALGRWADPAALESYGNGLRSGGLTANGVLELVLTSEERRQQSRSLPGPFDVEFPFAPTRAN